MAENDKPAFPVLRLAGPTFDRILNGVADVLDLTKDYLKARTAESNINAHHTRTDQEFLRQQVKKKDDYIKKLQSRLDGGDRRQPRGRPEQPRDERPPFNGIRGAQTLRIEGEKHEQDEHSEEQISAEHT